MAEVLLAEALLSVAETQNTTDLSIWCKHFKYNLELYHCFVIKNYVCCQYKESFDEEKITQLNIILLLSCFHFCLQCSQKLHDEHWIAAMVTFIVEPVLNSRRVPSESTLIVKSQNWLGVIHQVYLLNLKTITDHKMNQGVHRILGSQHWL